MLKMQFMIITDTYLTVNTWYHVSNLGTLVETVGIFNKLQAFMQGSVTSTSQHQIFDEKFDQEPESVRVKMADLAGR